MTHYVDKAVETKGVTNYAAADVLTIIDAIAATMVRDNLWSVDLTWHDRKDLPITMKVRR